jgi:beta-lactamase regulating signal transducer with metallopeptidase domain
MPPMPTDIGQRAFLRALGTAGCAAGLVIAAGALLQPLGAFAHLRGMATQLCVTITHITSDIASVSLVLVTASAIMVGAFALVASVVVHHRALRGWIPVDGVDRRRVARIARAHGIRSRTVVFEHPEAIACSRGVVLPEIWISNAAVSALNDDELAAVIAHEHQHCVSRDPAKRQLLEVLSRALFAFPIVAEAARQFRRAAEYAADDAAARRTSSRDTASALLRFAGAPSVPAVVQFGASVTVGERVQRLLGHDSDSSAPDVRARAISAVVAAATIVCIVLVAILPTNM